MYVYCGPSIIKYNKGPFQLLNALEGFGHISTGKTPQKIFS